MEMYFCLKYLCKGTVAEWGDLCPECQEAYEADPDAFHI